MNIPEHAVKIVAIGLSSILFITNGLGASTVESSFWAERQARLSARHQLGAPAVTLPPMAAATPASPGVDEGNPSLSTLPQQYGRWGKVSGPIGSDTGRRVFTIQDVHQNNEAQARIGDVLGELLARQKVDLVALEGAFGTIDLRMYKRYPRPESIQAVADYLFKEKKISGAIHHALTTDTSLPPFVGVDSLRHYWANVEAYRNSAPTAKINKAMVTLVKNDLIQIKETSFSPALARFDTLVDGYRQEKIPFGDYLRGLTEFFRQYGRGNGGPGPATTSFLDALAFEESLNPSNIENERALLTAMLLTKLDRSNAERLIENAVAAKLGRLSHTAFYEQLHALCRHGKINLRAFPAMSTYMEYVRLSHSIDAEQLLRECKKMEDSVYAALAKTPLERDLCQKTLEIHLIAKLLDFALTPLEWAEYKSWAARVHFIGRNDDMKQGLAPFEAFYREAETRDALIAHNLLKAMEENNAKTAVLIAGGFHSKGTAKTLHLAGVSTIEFTPKITHIESGEGGAYLSVFTQEKSPLERIFSGQKLFLSPPQWPELLSKVEIPVDVLLYEKATGSDGSGEHEILRGLTAIGNLKVFAQRLSPREAVAVMSFGKKTILRKMEVAGKAIRSMVSKSIPFHSQANKFSILADAVVSPLWETLTFFLLPATFIVNFSANGAPIYSAPDLIWVSGIGLFYLLLHKFLLKEHSWRPTRLRAPLVGALFGLFYWTWLHPFSAFGMENSSPAAQAVILTCLAHGVWNPLAAIMGWPRLALLSKAERERQESLLTLLEESRWTFTSDLLSQLGIDSEAKIWPFLVKNELELHLVRVIHRRLRSNNMIAEGLAERFGVERTTLFSWIHNHPFTKIAWTGGAAGNFLLMVEQKNWFLPGIAATMNVPPQRGAKEVDRVIGLFEKLGCLNHLIAKIEERAKRYHRRLGRLATSFGLSNDQFKYLVEKLNEGGPALFAELPNTPLLNPLDREEPGNAQYNASHLDWARTKGRESLGIGARHFRNVPPLILAEIEALEKNPRAFDPEMDILEKPVSSRSLLGALERCERYNYPFKNSLLNLLSQLVLQNRISYAQNLPGSFRAEKLPNGQFRILINSELRFLFEEFEFFEIHTRWATVERDAAISFLAAKLLHETAEILMESAPELETNGEDLVPFAANWEAGDLDPIIASTEGVAYEIESDFLAAIPDFYFKFENLLTEETPPLMRFYASKFLSGATNAVEKFVADLGYDMESWDMEVIAALKSLLRKKSEVSLFHLENNPFSPQNELGRTAVRVGFDNQPPQMGTVVGENNQFWFILTSLPAIRPEKKSRLTVVFPFCKPAQMTRSGEFLAGSPDHSLALLRVEKLSSTEDVTSVTFRAQEISALPPKNSQVSVYLGPNFPTVRLQKNSPVVFVNTLSEKAIGFVMNSQHHAFEINPPLSPGFTGAPAFDAAGRFLGIYHRNITRLDKVTEAGVVLSERTIRTFLDHNSRVQGFTLSVLGEGRRSTGRNADNVKKEGALVEWARRFERHWFARSPSQNALQRTAKDILSMARLKAAMREAAAEEAAQDIIADFFKAAPTSLGLRSFGTPVRDRKSTVPTEWFSTFMAPELLTAINDLLKSEAPLSISPEDAQDLVNSLFAAGSPPTALKDIRHDLVINLEQGDSKELARIKTLIQMAPNTPSVTLWVNDQRQFEEWSMRLREWRNIGLIPSKMAVQCQLRRDGLIKNGVLQPGQIENSLPISLRGANLSNVCLVLFSPIPFDPAGLDRQDPSRQIKFIIMENLSAAWDMKTIGEWMHLKEVATALLLARQA